MTRWGVWIVACAWVLSSGGAAAGDWQFMIGPTWRGGMQLEIEGSSDVQRAGLHAAQAISRLPARPAAAALRDDIGRFGDRSFDDGFVNQDMFTANDGLTWYWGYQSNAQYDAAAETLTFRRAVDTQTTTATLVQLSTTRDAPVDIDEQVNAAGLQLALARSVYGSEKITIDLLAGLDWLRGERQHPATTTYSETVRERRVAVTDTVTDRYTFSTHASLQSPMPQAPYAGDYAGPGTLIENRPSSAQRLSQRSVATLGTSTWEAANQVEFDVESDLYALGLGVRVGGRPAPWLTLFILPRVTLNLLDLQLDRRETFTAVYADGRRQTLGQWEESDSQTQWLWGAGVAAGAEVEIAAGFSLALQGGYDWVFDTVEATAGPNRASFDGSGYNASLLVGKRF
jgi:hypothetical protein